MKAKGIDLYEQLRGMSTLTKFTLEAIICIRPQNFCSFRFRLINCSVTRWSLWTSCWPFGTAFIGLFVCQPPKMASNGETICTLHELPNGTINASQAKIGNRSRPIKRWSPTYVITAPSLERRPGSSVCRSRTDFAVKCSSETPVKRSNSLQF